jgi:hypothetical protein
MGADSVSDMVWPAAGASNRIASTRYVRRASILVDNLWELTEVRPGWQAHCPVRCPHFGFLGSARSCLVVTFGTQIARWLAGDLVKGTAPISEYRNWDCPRAIWCA